MSLVLYYYLVITIRHHRCCLLQTPSTTKGLSCQKTMSTFCQIVWNWSFRQEESRCLHVGGSPAGAFDNIVPFIFISFSFYFYPLLYLVSQAISWKIADFYSLFLQIGTGCQVKPLRKEVNIKHAGLRKKNGN